MSQQERKTSVVTNYHQCSLFQHASQPISCPWGTPLQPSLPFSDTSFSALAPLRYPFITLTTNIFTWPMLWSALKSHLFAGRCTKQWVGQFIWHSNSVKEIPPASTTLWSTHHVHCQYKAKMSACIHLILSRVPQVGLTNPQLGWLTPWLCLHNFMIGNEWLHRCWSWCCTMQFQEAHGSPA